MASHTYASIHRALQKDELRIDTVGAFWTQARLAPLQIAGAPVISVPVTLHLMGDGVQTTIYASMIAGPGVAALRRHKPAPAVAWSIKGGTKRQGTGVLKFSIPSFGLFWQGTLEDREALALGQNFAEILLEEFPDPVEDLERQFGCDIASLAKRLAAAAHAEAGTTLPENPK
jgi:hypothetical protein